MIATFTAGFKNHSPSEITNFDVPNDMDPVSMTAEALLTLVDMMVENGMKPEDLRSFSCSFTVPEEN